MTNHSRDDALTERQFELLLEGARDLPKPQAFEARVVILFAGRLGLRGGEIAHTAESWIDLDTRMLEIPSFNKCTKGKDGGACGYCRDRARERYETHNLSMEEARELVQEEVGEVSLTEEQLESMAEEKRADHNITFEEALAERWEPKTENGARSIPFDFDVRTELAVERFCERWDEWPKSRVAVNRRVNEAAEAAGIDEHVYPHSLRATAASFMAARNVSATGLMSVFGWKDLETARTYIQANDKVSAKEIRSKYR